MVGMVGEIIKHRPLWANVSKTIELIEPKLLINNDRWIEKLKVCIFR